MQYSCIFLYLISGPTLVLVDNPAKIIEGLPAFSALRKDLCNALPVNMG